MGYDYSALEPLATNRAEALNVESTEIDGTDEVN